MYIFFDIDNTLVSHKVISHIPPETLEAVNMLKSAGHIPAIATGRGGFLTFTTAQVFGIDYRLPCVFWRCAAFRERQRDLPRYVS